MFRSRRRVPSEGALRVLRQLAYISSGTACGAAAIIAEERRRQTNLVSKIADNSRRLKQHPRYQHTRSAHARHAHDAASLDATAAVDCPTSDHSPVEDLVPQADAFRNSLLPSEVDRGYSKLAHHRQPNHPDDKTRSKSQPSNTNSNATTSFSKGVESQSNLVWLEGRCWRITNTAKAARAWRYVDTSDEPLGPKEMDSKDVLPMAGRLFDAFFELQRWNICRKILHWMRKEESLVTQTHDCVHRWVLACTAPAQYGNLTWLYKSFHDRFSLPASAYPDLCAAYSTTEPQLCALLFAKHIPKSERLAVLPSCEPAWPNILEHMWSKTRNYALVESLFIEMCRLTDAPSLNLFNAMVLVCIKSRNFHQAHRHLQTIQESQSLEPDVVTYGHFVLLITSNFDWSATNDLMAMLSRAGESEAPPKKRTDLFVPVFEAYCNTHPPEEALSFALQAIETYGVLPDQRILHTAIQAFIRAGRLDMIPVWVDKMKTYDQDIQISPNMALQMIRRFYFENRPSHTILLWLCRCLVRHVSEYWSHGVLALLREAIAFDVRGYRSRHGRNRSRALLMLERLQDADSKISVLPKPLSWYQMPREMDQARLEMLFPVSNSEGSRPIVTGSDSQGSMEDDNNRPFDDSSDVIPRNAALKQQKQENDMLVALSEGRFTDVIDLYEETLGLSGLPASSYSLEMAIQARTKLPDEAGPFKNHLDLAHEAGLNTTAAMTHLLSHKVRNTATGEPMHVDQLRDTVLSFYEKMDEHNVPIRHHFATAAASILLRSNKPLDAIYLLSTVHKSHWTHEKPFDLPAMTVLLQAYTRIQHASGIEWVIKEVLTQNYRIDFAFLAVIRNARKQLYSRSSSHAPRTDRDIKTCNLARMLDYYAQVCSAKQRMQIKRASRLGNRLVQIMIGLARPGEAVATPSMPGELDASGWGKRLCRGDGRRAVWRVMGARRKHERARDAAVRVWQQQQRRRRRRMATRSGSRESSVS